MNKNHHNIYIGLYFVIGILVTIFFLVNGYEYYTTPIEERFFNANHSLLKPSGYLGHGIGIIGSLMMIFGVAIYMIRKRVKKFARLGILKYWLEFHIFLCTVGPILVLFHTAFKFGGIVAVCFWCMVAVVLSGVIGRFIYIQIPKTIQGKELDIKELDEINYNYTFQLRKEFNIDENILLEIDNLSSADRYKTIPLFESILIVFKESITNKKLIRQFKKQLIASGIPKENLTLSEAWKKFPVLQS